jgi:hypothetical protein
VSVVANGISVSAHPDRLSSASTLAHRGLRRGISAYLLVSDKRLSRLAYAPADKSAVASRHGTRSAHGVGRSTNRPAPQHAGAPDAHMPSPPSELGLWLLAFILCALGVVVLTAVLTGAVGRTTHTTTVPPPRTVIVASAIPLAARRRPGATEEAAAATVASRLERNHLAARGGERAVKRLRYAAIASRASAARREAEELGVDPTETHISRAWMEGFYPIYATAQSTFGVNWLLLASIHRQESAFSTARGTYQGLNFAGCCGGPMQFNVTNGPVSTWDLVADSYEYGKRPARYDHMTASHPSIYDDFDAIMAAAHLLSADGAEYALNESAWDAAYDYYGHDATGVTYADQVLARAISWSQHGFCINCGLESAMVEAVQAAYGVRVLRLHSPEAPTSISHVRGQR